MVDIHINICQHHSLDQPEYAGQVQTVFFSFLVLIRGRWDLLDD